MNAAACWSVRNFGIGSVRGGMSPCRIGFRPWRVGPVPFDESLEEDADHAQPVPLGVLRQRRRLGAGLGGEPHLVVLDMNPGDVADDCDVGVR